MREEWNLRGLLTKGWETKEGLSAQRNAKLSLLPLLSPKTFPSQSAFSCLTFTPLLHYPLHSLPASKKSHLDLWSSTIQTPCHSKSTSRLSPFSWSYSHPTYFILASSVTWWYNPRTRTIVVWWRWDKVLTPRPTSLQEHTGGFS